MKFFSMDNWKALLPLPLAEEILLQCKNEKAAEQLVYREKSTRGKSRAILNDIFYY